MSDPLRDHRLHIELLEDEAFRARLFRDEDGGLRLRFYGGEGTVIPVEWLLGIVRRFQEEFEATPHHGQ